MAAAKCVGPLSLPIARVARRATAASCRRFVRPVRSMDCGARRRISSASGVSLAMPQITDGRSRWAARVPNRSAGQRFPGRAGEAPGSISAKRGGRPRAETSASSQSRLGRGEGCDPRGDELPALPLRRMQKIALRIGVRMRSPRSDARPFGTTADEEPVARGSPGGLQVIDTIEAGASQTSRQAQNGSRAPPAGPAVGPDPVEPGAFGGQCREEPRRQERDLRLRVVCPDGGEGAEGLHEVAERGELDDEDPLGHSNSR